MKKDRKKYRGKKFDFVGTRGNFKFLSSKSHSWLKTTLVTSFLSKNAIPWEPVGILNF